MTNLAGIIMVNQELIYTPHTPLAARVVKKGLPSVVDESDPIYTSRISNVTIFPDEVVTTTNVSLCVDIALNTHTIRDESLLVMAKVVVVSSKLYRILVTETSVNVTSNIPNTSKMEDAAVKVTISDTATVTNGIIMGTSSIVLTEAVYTTQNDEDATITEEALDIVHIASLGEVTTINLKTVNVMETFIVDLVLSLAKNTLIIIKDATIGSKVVTVSDVILEISIYIITMGTTTKLTAVTTPDDVKLVLLTTIVANITMGKIVYAIKATNADEIKMATFVRLADNINSS